MPSSDRTRRRRHRVVLLALAASLLGFGASAPARGQDAGGATGETLFGTYQLEARALGVQGRYELEGILPGGAPVFDLTLPETLARFSSGPLGYGLAGLAYPGPLFADLGVLAAQGGFGSEDDIPPWPIRAQAFYPTGPVEESTGPEGTVQKVVAGDLGVLAQGTFPAIDAPPLISVGSITSAARSAIEGSAAISRSRVVLSDIKILGGVITIESIVTDLVAAHDGSTGSTSGGTTASGVEFLGLAAALNEDGLVLEEAPPVEGPGAPLGGVLDPLVDPLSGLTAPVQDLLDEVLQQAVPQLDDVLGQAGIELSILDPEEAQVDSGAATLESSGVRLTMSFKGREQAALVDLVNSIPPELKPSLGPLPSPVSFLAENHITSLAIGPATVSALATPPFPAFEVPPLTDIPLDPGLAPGLPSLGDPGFATPAAPLPTPPATSGPVDAEPIANALGGALPAALVALALLASPLFGFGTTRLADNVLAPVSSSCPSGLDKPIDTQRSP